MNGARNGTFFGPAPWGPGEGSNIIKFQLQSQFQRCLNQTLCVFSQMKDTCIKHIRQDFHIWPGVMPQGWDLGYRGGLGGGGGIRNSTRFGA